MRKLFLFLFLITASTCSVSNNSDHFKPEVAPYFNMVDAEFDQDQAFSTVAYIEKYFRVVGNEGFNNSIHYVERLLESQGFIPEKNSGPDDRLIYRVEKRPLEKAAWEPFGGSLIIDGEEVLNYQSNRNMIAINSYSTNGKQEYEVIHAGVGRDLHFTEDVAGKVVFAETSVGYLFNEAVIKRGAAGVLAYRMPDYTKPEINQTSIQFSSIQRNEDAKSFGLLLSYAAKEKLLQELSEGKRRVSIDLHTKFEGTEELTVVAELKGSVYPEERFVFSAHVQEPGANDNASGVGALAEVASTSARLLKAGKIDPKRTITYLFGDEIVSTRRYIQEDSIRAEGIKWGMSLDMVGENPAITGGTFLIEKMPDPGAIWVRGEEQHTEWGGRILSKDELTPHYYNDFIINRFKEIGKAKNWVVNANPFEGGSDHVPFLRADIPGLLLWHFTDQFYHTSNDRLDKVSATTLKNVGTGALISALILTSDPQKTADFILDELKVSAIMRLNIEYDLSEKAIFEGGDIDLETDIINTWGEWYINSLQTISDLFPSDNQVFQDEITTAVDGVGMERDILIKKLKAL